MELLQIHFRSPVVLANNATAILSLFNLNNTILSLSGGGVLGGNVTMGSGTLTIANAIPGSSTSYAGVISGSGGLTLNLTGAGSPVQTLTGSNTYTGTTTITSGTLRAGAANTFASGSAVNLANSAAAILDLNGFSNSIASLSGGGGLGGDVLLGAGTLTIANAIPGSSTSYAGTISGSGGLTLNLTGAGSPAQTLSGSNTYTGTTTVNDGTLVASNTNALGSTLGGTIVNIGATLQINNVNIGNESVTLNNATIVGTGTAGLAGLVTLGAGTSDTINAVGDLNLSGGINPATAGTVNLTLQGAGNLSVAGGIGAGNALLSLTLNTALNLSGNTAVSSVGAINLANGINGGANDLTLTAPTINLSGLVTLNDLALNGSNIDINAAMTLNNLIVTGTGGNNTFSLNDGGTQAWTVTAGNGGSVANSSILGSGTFANIQNITGGIADDTFALSGGTLTGNVNGGGGLNTFTGDNVANVWNIAGTNSGTVTGVGGVLSNMQNLVGGTAGNQFIFADNASVTGYINGVNLATTNTLNYSAYTTPVTIVLSTNKFNGTTFNNGNTITNYLNFNNLIGNGQAQSILVLTPEQLSQAVATGPMAGFIGDPVFWSGFNVSFPASTQTILNGPNVSPIIQQPQVENETQTNQDWVVMASTITQNLDSIITDAETLFDTSLSDIKINPYCYQAQ